MMRYVISRRAFLGGRQALLRATRAMRATRGSPRWRSSSHAAAYAREAPARTLVSRHRDRCGGARRPWAVAAAARPREAVRRRGESESPSAPATPGVAGGQVGGGVSRFVGWLSIPQVVWRSSQRPVQKRAAWTLVGVRAGGGSAVLLAPGPVLRMRAMCAMHYAI